jgi:ribosomal protein S18 acetylase RimI-like enzyme
MPAPATLRVVPVAACDRAVVLGLRVHPHQRDYVGPIGDLLADAAHSGDGDALVFVHGDAPVGYCRLDATARAVAGHDFVVAARGLRSFFIDADWQGRGLAGQALEALFADLAERDPATRLLVLAVNCRNRVAQALYRRAGFEVHGGLYHGGRAGPQQLMLRYLDAPT